MSLYEHNLAEENTLLRKELAKLKLMVEPKRPSSGGVCQAMNKDDCPCEGRPDYELFIPAISAKPFVLCELHKSGCATIFSALGVFYKIFEHDYKGKQRTLFSAER